MHFAFLRINIDNEEKIHIVTCISKYFYWRTIVYTVYEVGQNLT